LSGFAGGTSPAAPWNSKKTAAQGFILKLFVVISGTCGMTF